MSPRFLCVDVVCESAPFILLLGLQYARSRGGAVAVFFAKLMAPKRRASPSPARRSTRSKSPAAARAVPAAKSAKPSSKTWSGLQPWTGEEDYYCLGRPKPLLRGQLHFYSAVLSPVWSGFQLSLCHTAQEVVAVILACIGATAMLDSLSFTNWDFNCYN